MTNESKIKFPADTHDFVMIVRTSIESVVFLVFIFFSQKINWLQNFPQLNALKLGVSAALFFSLIFLALTIQKRIKDKSIKSVTYYESIADAVMIIWLIFIFGGMNGSFFFFFFLALMEAAFTFNFPVILTVIIMGIISIIGDYFYQLYIGAVYFDVSFIFVLFFRIVTVGLIGYYSYSFMNSVKKERLASKNLRLAYEELQKLDKAKSEFISIASHQLRTPLSAIKGYVSMILDGNYGEISKTSREKMKNVLQSNERLIRLVNNLLNISRIESGKTELNLQESSIEKVIDTVVDFLSIEAKKKKISLNWKKPETPLPNIFIDADKIRELMLNLTDNAIKYTQKGEVRITADKEGDSIMIKISDTGTGLSQEEISKLFQSFSRGISGIEFHPEGIGIGLYIARKFAELHNGRIWVESPGKGMGTTFYVALPLKQPIIKSEVN